MVSSPQPLPNAEMASVEEKKITEYLLSDTHPQGRSKAQFFRAFGFVPERGAELAEALVRHAQTGSVVSQVSLPDSTQYAIEGELPAPDGRRPQVRTVWETRPGGEPRPRLITAYPTSART